MPDGTISTSAVKRSTILGIVISAVFAVLLFRILIIQTVNFDKYQSKVINQMTTELTVKAKRGNIYDRNGNVLATDMTAYNLIISPRAIKELKIWLDIRKHIKIQRGYEDHVFVSRTRGKALSRISLFVFIRKIKYRNVLYEYYSRY